MRYNTSYGWSNRNVKLALRGLAIFLFMPLAALTAFSFALNRTVTQQDYIKENLRTSGIYSAVSLQAQNSFIQSEDNSELPKPVQQALASALTPAAMQSIIEPLIEKTYTVLDDPNQLHTTTIDISPLKKQFRPILHKHIVAYARSLPVCSVSQLPHASSDLLQATCRPTGINITQLATQATNEIMNSPRVPKDSVALGEILGENQTGGSFVNQLSGILRWTRLSIFISSLLLLLAIAAVIWLSNSVRAGIHRLTTLLLTAAILFAGTSGLFLFALQRVNFGGAETLSIESSLGSSLRLLALEVFKVNLGFAAVYGAVGIALLIGLYATEKKNPTTQSVEAR